jgi:hypothetical protein
VIPLDESSTYGLPTFALPQDIVATIMDIVTTAWSQVLMNKEVNANDSETEIAGRLTRAMRTEKKRRPALHNQIRIEEEVGTRSDPSVPKPEGRIDIKIIYSFDENEYFGVECKRVSSIDKNLARKYVTDGVMRFVGGKYSPGHDWAAMLGFVLDGNVADCVKAIREQVSRNHKTISLIDDWTPETSLGRYSDLYRTRHQQHNRNSTMVILHLFLPIH